MKTSTIQLSITKRIQLVEGNKLMARCYIRDAGKNTPLYLFRMYVSKANRGKGLGSKILDKAIEDFGKRPIKLRVGSSGPLNENDLKKWYGRYGFVITNGKTMLRKPNES